MARTDSTKSARSSESWDSDVCSSFRADRSSGEGFDGVDEGPVVSDRERMRR